MTITHGKYGTRTYNTWEGMKQRCHNSNNPRFCDYAGRGIFVCRRWRNSFENFYKDMGERPSGMTIDRINNNLGYLPFNCKWSSLKDQSRNTRRNHFLSLSGESKTIAEWSEIIGVAYFTLLARIKRGWTIKRALTTK